MVLDIPYYHPDDYHPDDPMNHDWVWGNQSKHLDFGGEQIVFQPVCLQDCKTYK